MQYETGWGLEDCIQHTCLVQTLTVYPDKLGLACIGNMALGLSGANDTKDRIEELGLSGEDLEEELGQSGEDLETTWRTELGCSKCILLDSWLLPTLSTGSYSPEGTLFNVASSVPETVWYLVGHMVSLRHNSS